jgi:hypothetical protein
MKASAHEENKRQLAEMNASRKKGANAAKGGDPRLPSGPKLWVE